MGIFVLQQQNICHGDFERGLENHHNHQFDRSGIER